MPIVLVVDDSPIDLRIAGECVEQCGGEPRFASSGEQALESVETDPPDIVLTDLVMPGMSGLDLVRETRQRNPSLPIIVMTGKGSEAAAIEALKSGATSYISKANLIRDLADTLRNVLDAVGSRQLRDQVRSFLQSCELEFELDYQNGGTQAIIGFVQVLLENLNYFDATQLLHVSTALSEAVTNAMELGNLELDSAWRDEPDNKYRELANERLHQSPYCNRRVFLRLSLLPDRLVIRVRDEGPGFDPSQLPDPTAPEYLLRPSGRGILLMRTFMDEVAFNETGNEITMVKYRNRDESEAD